MMVVCVACRHWTGAVNVDLPNGQKAWKSRERICAVHKEEKQMRETCDRWTLLTEAQRLAGLGIDPEAL